MRRFFFCHPSSSEPYGLNFELPELKWALGYPFAIAMMTLSAMGRIYIPNAAGGSSSERQTRKK